MVTPKLETEAALALRRPRRARKIILVVEDEKLVRWTIREGLRRDYRVYAAASAEEALEILPRLKGLNGILVDVRLPGMDGLAFSQKVRDVWPKAKVFVMTAYNHESAPKDAFGVRADGYLAKPFALQVLKDMLASHLGGSSA
jgi:CheY-like chemotaxis protein